MQEFDFIAVMDSFLYQCSTKPHLAYNTFDIALGFNSDILRLFPQAMVKYNRLELLNHPVCKKYLHMKWCVSQMIFFVQPNVAHVHIYFCFILRVAYGIKAHIMNMLMYMLGVVPLTHLIVTLRPSFNTTETGEHVVHMVPISFKEVGLFIND